MIARSKRAPQILPVFKGEFDRVLSELERGSLYLVLVWLALIVAIGVIKAWYKPLWLDEIMSVLISKLPNSADIWAVCKSGADNQPPFYHYVTRACVRLFGNDAFGVRAPSLAGYILLCTCLYWFLARRTSRLYGLIALLIPGVTGCWEYATEARPYALVMGCAAMAAVCWQSIVMEEKRRLALFGLSISLAAAFSLHYFSPVLIAPFAFAELVRTYRRRRPDFSVWLALAIPFLVLIPLVPVILATRINSGLPFAWYARPSLYGSLENFASQFLNPSLVALIALNCIYLVYRILWPRQTADFVHISKLKELAPDAALILGLTIVPVLAVLLAKLVTHVFFNRYAATGMIGIVALIAAGIWLAFSGRKGPAVAAMLVFGGVFAHRAYYDLKSAHEQWTNLSRGGGIKHVPSAAGSDNLPIVAAGPNEFMDLTQYGDRALRHRLYYVSSEQIAARIMGFSFLERMMIGSAPFFGTQVMNYDDFLQAHPKFYLFGSPNWWLYPKLIADHARIEMLQAGLADQFGNYADFFCLVDTHRSRN